MKYPEEYEVILKEKTLTLDFGGMLFLECYNKHTKGDKLTVEVTETNGSTIAADLIYCGFQAYCIREEKELDISFEDVKKGVRFMRQKEVAKLIRFFTDINKPDPGEVLPQSNGQLKEAAGAN